MKILGGGLACECALTAGNGRRSSAASEGVGLNPQPYYFYNFYCCCCYC